MAEPDDAVDGGEQGVVATAAHVVAGVNLTALAHDDRAGATFVPVVTFTPSRCDAESRPFLEEAAPLLLRHVRVIYAFFGGRFVADFLVAGRGAFFAVGAFLAAGAFFSAGAFLGVPPAVFP